MVAEAECSSLDSISDYTIGAIHHHVSVLQAIPTSCARIDVTGYAPYLWFGQASRMEKPWCWLFCLGTCWRSCLIMESQELGIVAVRKGLQHGDASLHMIPCFTSGQDRWVNRAFSSECKLHSKTIVESPYLSFVNQLNINVLSINFNARRRHLIITVLSLPVYYLTKALLWKYIWRTQSCFDFASSYAQSNFSRYKLGFFPVLSGTV